MQRYEHARPGDLLHLDIKRLACIARPSHRVIGDRRDTVKGIGAEYVHVAIDDHCPSLSPSSTPMKMRAAVLHFLHAALAYYARLGIHSRPCSPTTELSTVSMPSPTPVSSLA